jgi:hypothetical protein
LNTCSKVSVCGMVFLASSFIFGKLLRPQIRRPERRFLLVPSVTSSWIVFSLLVITPRTCHFGPLWVFLTLFLTFMRGSCVSRGLCVSRGPCVCFSPCVCCGPLFSRGPASTHHLFNHFGKIVIFHDFAPPSPLVPSRVQNSGMSDLSQRHLIRRAIRRRCRRYPPFLPPGIIRPKNRGEEGRNVPKRTYEYSLDARAPNRSSNCPLWRSPSGTAAARSVAREQRSPFGSTSWTSSAAARQRLGCTAAPLWP